MKLKLITSAILIVVSFAMPATAQQTQTAEETYRQIEETLGTVPTYLRAYPPSAISGAWQMHLGLMADKSNALDFKVKSLINLAVAAQIPCEYCIWLETKLARSAGATDAEISEAVAQAGYVRNWSAVIHGLQMDFETFKQEFGGE